MDCAIGSRNVVFYPAAAFMYTPYRSSGSSDASPTCLQPKFYTKDLHTTLTMASGSPRRIAPDGEEMRSGINFAVAGGSVDRQLRDRQQLHLLRSSIWFCIWSHVGPTILSSTFGLLWVGRGFQALKVSLDRADCALPRILQFQRKTYCDHLCKTNSYNRSPVAYTFI